MPARYFLPLPGPGPLILTEKSPLRERRAQQPAPRRPRVYQDGASDDNRTRRGFTPDTPSFLKRNNNK